MADLRHHARRAQTAKRLNAAQHPRQPPLPHPALSALDMTTMHAMKVDVGMMHMQVLNIPTLLTLCRVAAIPVTMAGVQSRAMRAPSPVLRLCSAHGEACRLRIPC